MEKYLRQLIWIFSCLLFGISGSSQNSATNLINIEDYLNGKEIRIPGCFNHCHDCKFTIDGIIYKFITQNGKKDSKGIILEVEGVDPELRNVVIPSKMKYHNKIYTVASIYGEAFRDIKNLESIIIPGSIEELDYRTFNDCTSLKSVILQEGVKVVGGFTNCTALERVSLPNSLIEIENDTFEYCNSLQIINLPKNLRKIGTNAFAWCESLSEITIPGSLREGGGRMFEGCKNLKSVIIELGCAEIFDSQFTGCQNLTDIKMPNSIKTIGSRGFEKTGIKKIILPSALEKIGYGAFMNCNNLSEIKLPFKLKSIDESAFYNCSSLTEITIPASVNFIGSDAFVGCSKMSVVRVLNPVPFPERGAFDYHNSMILYVPSRSIRAYKEDKESFGGDFKAIKAL